MNKKRLFAYGLPRLYGGASTELYHQIILWLRMGYEVHVIADADDYRDEPLYPDLLGRGVVVHGKDRFDCLSRNDVVISFCNKSFLLNLPLIHKRTRRTVYVNCMRKVSSYEAKCVRDGLIAISLYQTREVLSLNSSMLALFDEKKRTRFMMFSPYFDEDRFPFVAERSDEFFGCGRISRNDPGKYSPNTLPIYELFSSPKPKKGIFMGFGDKVREKVGDPPDWIRTVCHPYGMSQREFYQSCDIVLQPSSITENWPRIGFEAMSSGSVLIVNNRGGWREMVEHGRTGWLCDNPHDFVRYATKLAHEPAMREDMALAARERGRQLGGFARASESWQEVFDALNA